MLATSRSHSKKDKCRLEMVVGTQKNILHHVELKYLISKTIRYIINTIITWSSYCA